MLTANMISVVNQHFLTQTDAFLISSGCMLLGCVMTIFGFKIAPTVKRYLALLKLKIYMMQLKTLR